MFCLYYFFLFCSVNNFYDAFTLRSISTDVLCQLDAWASLNQQELRNYKDYDDGRNNGFKLGERVQLQNIVKYIIDTGFEYYYKDTIQDDITSKLAATIQRRFDASVIAVTKKKNSFIGVTKCNICNKRVCVSVVYDIKKNARWAVGNFTKHMRAFHKLPASTVVPSPIMHSPTVDDTTTTTTSDFMGFDDVDVIVDRISRNYSKTRRQHIYHMYYYPRIGYRSSAAVIKTPQDGKCLFRALAISLFGDGDRADSLRTCVVEHIGRNFEKYKHELQGCVYNYYDRPIQKEEMHELCVHYLFKRLAEPNFWGGSETLSAVCDMFNVNIAIFNEEDTVFFHKPLNKDTERYLTLAYRLGGHGIRNHYDVIVFISVSDLRIIVSSRYNKPSGEIIIN